MTKTLNTRIAAPFLTALDWIVTRDAAYRQSRKLNGMSDERLADMGLTRADAQGAFVDTPTNRRPRDTDRIPLSGVIASTRF